MVSRPYVPTLRQYLYDQLQYSRVLAGILTVWVLNTAARHTLAAQVPTPPPAPLLKFERRGDRLVATLAPALFATDILLKARVVTATSGAEPRLGASMTSGALRLRRVRDSLILAEYSGTRNGRLQYRRRSATPVLHTRHGSIIVDAAPLLAVLASRSGSATASLHTAETAFPAPVVGPPRATAKAPVGQPAATTVARVNGADTITYLVDVLRLPKVPMRGRLYDERVRYLTSEPASGPRYIERLRLEKRDPAAPVSDVVRQVIVRVTKTVPASLWPYAEKAVKDWNAAFESVGFRSVLRLQTDTDPPPADAVEFTVVAHEGDGGSSSDDCDPRSGEILRGDIAIGRDLPDVKLKYFTFLAMHDRRTRYPLPDEISGELFRIILTHELGHAIGLEHNFNTDSYPIDSLRRPRFVARMGFVPTIMSYSSMNFIAQPEDRFPPAALLAYVGVYDRWILNWGYRPIPAAATPEAELPILEQWRAAQDTARYLRPAFGGEHPDLNNPYLQPGLLGDDILRAVGYGIRNIARIAREARADLTPDLRSSLRRRWQIVMDYVVPVVGGIVPVPGPVPRHSADWPMQMIDSAYQAGALHLLMTRLFYGQDELVQQMLPAPPATDSTLVLFDSLVPEWEASETILQETKKFYRLPMRQLQENILAQLTSHLAALQQIPMEKTDSGSKSPGWQKIVSDVPGALAIACRELRVFRRRLAAYPRSSSSPAMQQHVDSLTNVLTPVFDSGGACAR